MLDWAIQRSNGRPGPERYIGASGHFGRTGSSVFPLPWQDRSAMAAAEGVSDSETQRAAGDRQLL